MTKRGVQFATITHAAGISSTGDPELDALLPFDEPYRIPAIDSRGDPARARGAAGASSPSARRSSARSNMQRAATASSGRARVWRRRRSVRRPALRVVDAILSGTHERGTSHYELLRAFADDATLTRIDQALEATGLPDPRVR